MKNDTPCPFGDRREEVLVAYLYDELESDDRERFRAHLPDCPPCRVEVADLAEVRTELRGWASPEPEAGVGGKSPRVPLRLAGSAPEPARTAPLRGRAPAWFHAAAAAALLAAGLGLANLRVAYTSDGLTVRTGWIEPPPAAVAPAAAPSPWQADLAALEQHLRAELTEARTASARTTSSDSDDLVRRVRGLIAESEQRQQRELALRVAQVAREAQAQRQADLVRIDRSLGVIQNRTGMEVMRTQRQLNSLAQRVSQQP